ncbi:GATA transcription factor 26-like isoform X2 [Tasmannia lanceolata]|uniref:GATA transcription factor 26-like isoform X2 n=1 Tax=Tasmannia lanceolata TaxID=3420 RepID=UPI0040629957
MGKQGPCYHCGVTSTPLWRNGPPEKPVLCNACGSRWRTKGSLTNYIPLHARADFLESELYQVPKVRSISIKTKEQKLYKRKPCNDNVEVEGEAPVCDQNFKKVLDEDTSNRSSSGSAISYSESCAHFGSTDPSSAQSNVWDSLVPSKKRTCVSRSKPSSVEKLTKDLYCILHEQQLSYLSGSSEEDLLFESETPMVSVEIGHGGVLIRHPNSAAREEESEASSLPVDNKTHILNGAYSGSASLPVLTESKGMHLPNGCNEKVKKLSGQGAQESTKRDKFSHDKFHLLRNSNSPLTCTDLRDVISFEEFMRRLTNEEQQQLMKYLPSIDTTKFPDSLKSMFDSPQFLEASCSFQQLLLEGIFDLSFSGVKSEECLTLKRLALLNLTKSKWVEQYNRLKDVKHKQIRGSRVAIGHSFHGSGNLKPAKKPRDGQNQNFPEPKGMMRSPKRVQRYGSTNLPYMKAPELNSSNVGIRTTYDTKEMDNEVSCLSPRSLFAFAPDTSSIMLDSLQFTDTSSDQDLLFDVPSNASFPQAELLHCHPWKQKTPPSNSVEENRSVGKEETLSNHPSSSLTSQQPSNSSMLYPHLVIP